MRRSGVVGHPRREPRKGVKARQRAAEGRVRPNSPWSSAGDGSDGWKAVATLAGGGSSRYRLESGSMNVPGTLEAHGTSEQAGWYHGVPFVPEWRRGFCLLSQDDGSGLEEKRR